VDHGLIMFLLMLRADWLSEGQHICPTALLHALHVNVTPFKCSYLLRWDTHCKYASIKHFHVTVYICYAHSFYLIIQMFGIGKYSKNSNIVK